MVNLISFEQEQLGEILNLLDIKTKVVFGETQILSEGEQAKCKTCKIKLTTDNLGNIARGSGFDSIHLLYCDNAACFAEHLAKKFEESSPIINKTRKEKWDVKIVERR